MKATTAVISLSFYLLTYTVLASMGASLVLLTCLYLLSPFLLIAMVYIVLKDDGKKYPELKPNREWGYADKEDF